MKKRALVKIVLLITALLLLIPIKYVYAEYSRVVTFGADLDRAQRAMIASEFGINLAEGKVPVVDVTNAEERKYLQGLVPENVIGTRAISSAMVEMLPQGQGITVNSSNITWVTNDMYSNALVTAGVRDARINVAAPLPVSGTAALTGIFKAVETATGKSLGDRSKRIANEELVETGKLGDEIGKDEAAKLIILVKERVVSENTRDPEKIRQIIINVAGDLNITLNNRQIEEITALMQKIAGLELRAKDIVNQLTGLKGEVERAVQRQSEAKTWLQRLLEIINQFIEQVRSVILNQS